MLVWHLYVETQTITHDVPISPNESEAKQALQQVQDQIGKQGVVVIAERLTLQAPTIISGWLVRHDR